MKKLTILVALTMLVASCKTEVKEEKTVPKSIAPVSEAMMESAVIYEANIRQYSPEGTFQEFTKDIPQLKDLGVKIIWLMPIFPISETKRKATGDKFAADFPEEERTKYLGSYYAVSDFRKINPEFGTLEDLRDLVKTAHDNDIYVILDWVPNHTGWDHTWITTNPDFYTKNSKGEITDPLNADGSPVGWADVADLNYDNQDLRKAMIADMMYWITEEGIDGFRCDVAGSVPTDFWQQAVPQLREKKEIFMLAEAWEPELMHEGLFDMAYGWDRHHTMNHIAKGDGNAKKWDENYAKDADRYEEDDILMTFVTNHDENSWNGTIQERMGDSWKVFTTLSYLAPGMPLIYSGQEYGMKHRLKFFEKDSIPHTKGKEWELLQQLGSLKNTNKALNGGKDAANYARLTSQDDVLAFVRKKGDAEVVFVGNLSDKKVQETLSLDGNYIDYFTNEEVQLNSKTALNLSPWDCKIYIKK